MWNYQLKLDFPWMPEKVFLGAPNGAFSWRCGDTLRMCNWVGRPLEVKNYDFGIFLRGDSFLIGNFAGGHKKGIAYLSKETLAFEDAEVFSNDWFVLKVKETNRLYDKDCCLRAEGFKEARVFKSSYALLYKDGWYLFDAFGQFVRNVDKTCEFVGDAIVLVPGEKGFFQLEDFEGKQLLSNIKSYEQMNENSFVLKDADGFSFMCDAQGKRVTEKNENALFLPDRCFATLQKGINKNIISGIYRPNGFMDPRFCNTNLFSVERTAYYYLINADNITGWLFDSKGKELGTGYKLVSSGENFALFEHDEKLKLFNQYGHVMTIHIDKA